MKHEFEQVTTLKHIINLIQFHRIAAMAELRVQSPWLHKRLWLALADFSDLALHSHANARKLSLLGLEPADKTDELLIKLITKADLYLNRSVNELPSYLFRFVSNFVDDLCRKGVPELAIFDALIAEDSDSTLGEMLPDERSDFVGSWIAGVTHEEDLACAHAVFIRSLQLLGSKPAVACVLLSRLAGRHKPQQLVADLRRHGVKDSLRLYVRDICRALDITAEDVRYAIVTPDFDLTARQLQLDNPDDRVVAKHTSRLLNRNRKLLRPE